MATPMGSKSNTEKRQNEISTLPKEKGWLFDTIYKYEGFWFEKPFLEGVFRAQQTFIPQPNNVILATFPKCGTTWFAALLFTIMNRARYNDYSSQPLLEKTPKDCLGWMEFQDQQSVSNADISISPLVKTHLPFTLLPESAKCTPECPIIYVCRNPADVFVSLWKFANKLRPKELPRLALDEAFDLYTQGACHYGSYWVHVLGYWNASKERPSQVLFLKNEDMKTQPITLMKKLANFVGCPFTNEEEEDGVIVKIVDFCSFESMAGLKVNQDPTERHVESLGLNISNNMLFRKGKIGDYENLLTDEMIQRLKMVTSMKFKDAGLEVFT